MRSVNAQAVGWALEQDLPPHLQHLLVVVASMADPNGLAWPSHKTVADLMGSTPETVRANFRKLVAAKAIVRYDRCRPNGSRTSAITVLLMGQTIDVADYGWHIGARTDSAVEHDPLGDALAAGGTGGRSPGGTGGSPPGGPVADHQARSVEKDQVERSEDRSTSGARASDRIPDDFPSELRPHARSVMRVLREMAEHHGAKEVTARAVGLVVMANRQKALVAEAYALASWASDSGHEIRDVVGRYRTWLKRADTMAGVERLDEQGMPCAPGPRGVVGSRVRPQSQLAVALDNHAEIMELEARGEA